jgi:hypothetical protein
MGLFKLLTVADMAVMDQNVANLFLPLVKVVKGREGVRSPADVNRTRRHPVVHHQEVRLTVLVPQVPLDLFELRGFKDVEAIKDAKPLYPSVFLFLELVPD